MHGAPSLSQHKFGGTPTVGDLWAASSPPALVKSARANLPTPPVWLLLTQAALEEKYSFLPRQICNNKAPAPKRGSANPQPLPARVSELHPQPVCLSVCPARVREAAVHTRLLLLSLIPLWGIVGYYKSL